MGIYEEKCVPRDDTKTFSGFAMPSNVCGGGARTIFLLKVVVWRMKQPILGGEESPETCELKMGRRVRFGTPRCHFPRSCACVILCWRDIYFCLLERRTKYPSVEWFERGLADREEKKLNPFLNPFFVR